MGFTKTLEQKIRMTQTQLPPYPLRIPKELREYFEKAAKENGRSLHAEILYRLNESILIEGNESLELVTTNSDALLDKMNDLKSLRREISALRSLLTSKEFASLLIRQGLSSLAPDKK